MLKALTFSARCGVQRVDVTLVTAQPSAVPFKGVRTGMTKPDQARGEVTASRDQDLGGPAMEQPHGPPPSSLPVRPSDGGQSCSAR